MSAIREAKRELLLMEIEAAPFCLDFDAYNTLSGKGLSRADVDRALDELVKLGAISLTPSPRYGGVSVMPQIHTKGV